MSQITFTVTEEHLSKGVKTNSFCCPVALALIDAGYRDPVGKQNDH